MVTVLKDMLSRLAARQDLILVALLALTVGMILPVPTALADVLIALNIGISMILMMAAVYVRSPVQLSTLPVVILLTTAFRLSLSIITSRMVLVQADAGEIIWTFGEFVKDDAIASLIIIVVNLVGGITIGCLQQGMSFADATWTYALPAVGDGLIAQIPALLVSLTAGITVTRVTSEDGGTLGHDIVEQLGGEPRTLQVAVAVLAGLALVPGFPAVVFLAFAGILGTVSVLQGAAAGFVPRRPSRPPAPPPRTGRWRFW